MLKTPANTIEQQIPAVYKTITKTVVQTPAKTVEREVPPEYRVFTKQVLATPATTKEVAIPAEYTTLTTQKLVRDSGWSEWVEVLCEQKATKATISEIQQALRNRGYSVTVDGILGPETRQALDKFQKDNNLPRGHATNLATLKALGLSY